MELNHTRFPTAGISDAGCPSKMRKNYMKDVITRKVSGVKKKGGLLGHLFLTGVCSPCPTNTERKITHDWYRGHMTYSA